MNKNELSTAENTSRYNDGIYCPKCKGKLEYEFYHYNHIGSYKCSNCGHARKEPQYAVTKLNLDIGEMQLNSKYNIKMSLRSIYNAYNVLAAYAVTSMIGLKEDDIVRVLNNYIIKNDRIQKFNINGHEGMLLTSKHENSISYNQSLSYIVRENNPCTVIIIIDAVSRKYFTSETSWIWDIDFELLKSNAVKKIVLAGKYAYDLAIRFKHTEIDNNKIVLKNDLDEMMQEIKDNAEGNIYVVTCFSDRMKFMNRLK
jgi:Zn ribbon nucleic-acid-binding protein